MMRAGINPLRTVKQDAKPTTRACFLTGQPGNHRNLPASMLAGRQGNSGSFDHTAAGVRSPAHR